jgi:hypothetical protein
LKTLILFLLFVTPVFSSSPYPISVTDEDKYVAELIERARYWAEILVMKSPKYVWGGEGLVG